VLKLKGCQPTAKSEDGTVRDPKFLIIGKSSGGL
jgi:hypothetical protein